MADGVIRKNVHLYILVLLSALLSGCQGPNTTKTLEKGPVDYASWAENNPDGRWTRNTEAAVWDSGLASTNPADAAYFCPAYTRLSSTERTRFWVYLLSEMARYESQFDSARTYQESFTDNDGEPVISRGLLQLSIESARQAGYGCGTLNEAELHDPLVNLNCAVRILSYWVKEDGRIAGNKSAHKGGGRYWAVLRQQSGAFPKIRLASQQHPVCRIDPE